MLAILCIGLVTHNKLDMDCTEWCVNDDSVYVLLTLCVVFRWEGLVIQTDFVQFSTDCITGYPAKTMGVSCFGIMYNPP